MNGDSGILSQKKKKKKTEGIRNVNDLVSHGPTELEGAL